MARVMALCLGAAAARPRLFAELTVVARLGDRNPARYFGLVAFNGSLVVYARTGHFPHADPSPRTLLWERCDFDLRSDGGRCVTKARALHARWPPSLAHNAAVYMRDDRLYVVGGLWGPGPQRRGLEQRGPFSNVEALARSESGVVVAEGTHAGCVDRRPRQRGACEFDGKLSVVITDRVRLYARANLVRRNASNGMFGGRHVQVVAYDQAPATEPFRLVSIRGYRAVGAPSVSGDNAYFAVVLKNPAARGFLLLAPVVREEPARKAFIGLAFSCDGTRFSEFIQVLDSTPASYGRGTDHPVDGLVVRGSNVYFYIHRDVPGVFMGAEATGRSRLVRYTTSLSDLREATERALDCAPEPAPPLDFDACWLACLARARARGDTRRGGFLDTCLEPCYPPPGDECRRIRHTYGVVPGTSWGEASASVQVRWAALSCDDLVSNWRS